MRLNLFKAIQNDAILMMSVLFAIVPQLFVMYQTNFYLYLDWSSYSTIALTSLSSLANLVFFGRLFDIVALLQKGNVVQGTVIWKNLVRDRGTLGVCYECLNVRYEKKYAIMVTKSTNSLNQGSEVSIVWDAKNPKHALIGSLVSDAFEV